MDKQIVLLWTCCCPIFRRRICKRGNVREDNAVKKIGLVVRKYDHYDDDDDVETDKVGVHAQLS